MLNNHLKIAWRNLLRYKGYTFINVFGLAVGIAACLLILLYVQDERSYDTFHEHADRIARVTLEQRDEAGASSVHGVLLDPPVAPLLKETYPEVLAAARLTPVGPLLSHEDRHVDSGECYWADPDIFEIFTLPLLAGDAETALVEPFSLVLSVSKAEALFSDDLDPAEVVGQTVIVNNEHAFTVTGVFADLPHNTHLPIDVLGSVATMESWFGPLDWGSPNYATYLLLAEGTRAQYLEEKLSSFPYRGDEEARLNQLHLQRLTDIHLRSHLVNELAPNGDIRYVYLLSAVALFILLIACINFMNLSTARSARRAREVGMRKVVGAWRGNLIGQFLGESVLFAFLSLALAVMFVELALPAFNTFTGKELGFANHNFFALLGLLVAIGLLVGIAAGSYPAFYLSAFRPAAVLKGRVQRGGRRSAFRSVLVVTQFIIAIVLLVSTLVVYRQLTFVQQQNLGFNEEHVLILPTVWDIKENFDPFRERLLRHPDVIDVAQSNPVPSRRLSWTSEVRTPQTRTGELASAALYPAFADPHFFPTYEIELVAGRNFSDEVASDSTTGFILNELAVQHLGWSSPQEAVGAPLQLGGWRGSVLGVVADFHFESLHQRIAPMIFYMDPRNYRQVSIRIRPGTDLPALIDFLEDRWQEYEPNAPLSYTFLDERFGATYAAERKLGTIFSSFAGLAFIITCLGLLGMAAFTTEQRTKEIGVRKVLGASVGHVVLLLSREFLVLVLVAFAVAAPIAYLAMQRWLDNFAYHAALSWWIFFLAGALALAVALLTVSYQSIKAALADPVKSLRYE